MLSKLGLLSAAETEAAVVSAWNPVRVGFKGAEDLWVRDVLNIGVDPRSTFASQNRNILHDNHSGRTPLVRNSCTKAGVVNKAACLAAMADAC